MSGSAGRRLRELARGRAKPWPDEVTVRFAIGYGALAGLCTTLAVTLSLLLAGGPSWGLVPVWFLLLAAGPTLATLLVSRSADRRRPLRALGGGLLSVLFQAVWAAPFSTLLGVVPRADSLLWPALLLCLANGGFCAFVVADVGREKPGRHTGTGRPEHRTGRQRPGGPAGHTAPPGPRARSQQEERAITEFGELLAAHPFTPTLPGVDYVQVADHSLALDAYERAKAAPGVTSSASSPREGRRWPSWTPGWGWTPSGRERAASSTPATAREWSTPRGPRAEARRAPCRCAAPMPYGWPTRARDGNARPGEAPRRGPEPGHGTRRPGCGAGRERSGLRKAPGPSRSG
ncbi:hypothetical protein ABZ712_22955 [Streptomyces sp. NPDC006906]|uniref:hypothetical protein n=1 Tax=Streptomyces sp. NPDC006906 TaxID=3154782 RepID=UPI0033C83968